MANTTNNQGFQNMSKQQHEEASRKGGEASSAKQDMSELGKKGAAAQPTEAKRQGGENSHNNS